MAAKISTIVLTVDLECERCYNKIRRVLCKIQDKMNIRTISFDQKTVTVSGPFDAEKVCRKLCSEAGKVIKELHVNGGKGEKASSKGKDGGGDKPKDGGKAEKKDEGKAEKKDDGKAEKDGGKAEKKDGGKGEKDGGKGDKKVKFDLEEAPPAAAVKPGKAMPPLPAGMSKADLAPLLDKIMHAKQGGGEPMMPPPAAAAQGVAVPSIWPAPAGPVSCYSYNPSAYDQTPYYGGGPPAAGGYYGVAPAQYDSQGWYHGNQHPQQPYYPHYQPPQQPYYSEDPNAACSVM